MARARPSRFKQTAVFAFLATGASSAYPAEPADPATVLPQVTIEAEHNRGYASLYFHDLSNIEHVEVMKGQAAVLCGRGSSGGLIKRVTKKPQAESFATAMLPVGSHGLKRIAIDANRGGDTVALRLTCAYEDSGSFRDRGFVERCSVAPSASFQLSSDTLVPLNARRLPVSCAHQLASRAGGATWLHS